MPWIVAFFDQSRLIPFEYVHGMNVDATKGKRTDTSVSAATRIEIFKGVA